jgi:hypothetical protein|tara:strand:+ start:7568 stop:8065 length:498 start_codon:yes stop_codon:yes gene_type:complete
MRPVIAQKKTTCHYCKEEISAGSRRYTDSIPFFIEGKRYIRTRHFHYLAKEMEESCFALWAEEVFDRLPEGVRTNNPRGRPALDLTPEQMKTRQRLLKSLRNQIRYYITGERVTMTPQLPTQMSVHDVKSARRFQENIERIKKELDQVGGVPARYLNTSVVDESE